MGDAERRRAFLAAYGVGSGSHSGFLLSFPWLSDAEAILDSFLKRLRIDEMLLLSIMFVLTLSIMYVVLHTRNNDHGIDWFFRLKRRECIILYVLIRAK